MEKLDYVIIKNVNLVSAVELKENYLCLSNDIIFQYAGKYRNLYDYHG